MKPALLLSVLFLGACAKLPPCPLFQGIPVHTDDGFFFVMDTDDLRSALQKIKGLSEGTCSDTQTESAPAAKKPPVRTAPKRNFKEG